MVAASDLAYGTGGPPTVTATVSVSSLSFAVIVAVTVVSDSDVPRIVVVAWPSQSVVRGLPASSSATSEGSDV